MPDLVTSRIFTDGEKGITATKMNDIIGSSSIQTSFVGSKPVASSTVAGDQLLLLTAGGTYARIDSSVFSSSIAALLPAPEPKIWAVRLRSFNAVGNPNFEVDQRNAGAMQAGWSGGKVIDRWTVQKTGTMVINAGQSPNPAPLAYLPGTNFIITRCWLRVVLTTAQSSLGTGDNILISQNVEGPNWRELQGDVHSISLLCRSSVANLVFAVSLRDAPTTRTLVKLCTIPTANTWTLISLPNLPVWDSGGTWSNVSGTQSYFLGICLAAGSSLMAPATDTWQTSGGIGAAGMTNFAAQATNSSFEIAAIQHEPGPLCTTLMDKPFSQNYDECLRYFHKSWPYSTQSITASFYTGSVPGVAPSASLFAGSYLFPKIMAKAPTISIYNPNSGGANGAYDETAATNVSTTGAQYVTEKNFLQVGISASGVAGHVYLIQYTADTGW